MFVWCGTLEAALKYIQINRKNPWICYDEIVFKRLEKNCPHYLSSEKGFLEDVSNYLFRIFEFKGYKLNRYLDNFYPYPNPSSSGFYIEDKPKIQYSEDKMIVNALYPFIIQEESEWLYREKEILLNNPEKHYIKPEDLDYNALRHWTKDLKFDGRLAEELLKQLSIHAKKTKIDIAKEVSFSIENNMLIVTMDLETKKSKYLKELEESFIEEGRIYEEELKKRERPVRKRLVKDWYTGGIIGEESYSWHDSERGTIWW